MKHQNIGSSLDDLLQEEEQLAQTNAIAIKRVLAWKITKAMQDEHVSKTEMAKRMHTSRAAFDRFLDPNSPSVTLLTMDKAAVALGKKLNIELLDLVP